MNKTVISVKQLNFYVRSLLEGDPNLTNVYVSGEISNFKNHYSSGHLYFSLKDDVALIRAVMFRSNAAHLKFVPEEGMKVICRGRVCLYDKDGQYQFYVDSIEPDGQGSLAVAFEQLKNKLLSEGLFDETHKKQIPIFPAKIAVITSDTGAALQDILNIISRRYPAVNVVVCPATVQGETAPASVINALNAAKTINPDTVIIARGGGSAEDLWCFNDEKLARVIYNYAIPVISAVGHETDFTICDFVSDLRAPTPSAAAELAVPNMNDILSTLSALNNRLCIATDQLILKKRSLLELYSNSAVLSKPIFADLKLFDVDKFHRRLISAFEQNLLVKEKYYSKLTGTLNALSPLNVLSRGYSHISKNSKSVTSVKNININDTVNITLSDGELLATVTDIKEKL